MAKQHGQGRLLSMDCKNGARYVRMQEESVPGRGNFGEERQLLEAGTCVLHLKQQNEGLGG